jgi:hypothetical protein
MEWHVQHRQEEVDLVTWHESPEDAIEAACQMADDGVDVFGIGTGPLSMSTGCIGDGHERNIRSVALNSLISLVSCRAIGKKAAPILARDDAAVGVDARA